MTTFLAFLARCLRRDACPLCRLPGAALAAALIVSAPPAWAVWHVNPHVNLPVCTQNGTQSSPFLLRDGRGGVFVGWADARSGTFNAYAHHVTPGGYLDPRWPATGRALAAQSQVQYSPKLFPDADSGAVAVWYDERGGLGQIYAYHLLADGDLDPVWPATGLRLGASSAIKSEESGAPDGSGGALVAWREYRGTWDIRAQRVSPTGSRLWDSIGVLVCDAAGAQSGLALVVDAAEGAVIAWVDQRAGSSNEDIYAHRVLASGVLDARWPANGRAICVENGRQNRVSVHPDGAGGAFLAWADNRSGTRWDLYAHHVRGDGTLDPAWPASGLSLRDSVTENLEPRIVSDGAGGMLVCSVRMGAAATLPAVQHLRANATLDPAWPGAGVSLPPGNYTFGMDADGAGGLVVVVGTEPYYECDLYAYHLLANGTWDLAWPATGVAVSQAALRQESPVVLADGAGGVFTAWTDERSGSISYDVYAQRVLADGTLGHPAPAITSIEDVPGDEGGRVLLAWSASEGDAAPNGYVSSYLLWRRITDPAAITRARVAADATGLPRPGAIRCRGEGTLATWWEFLAQVPAMRFPGYAYTVTTTGDAVPGGAPWNVFVVDAADDVTWSFYPSAPDSGYSVDNLAPKFPAPSFGWYADGATRLQWPPNMEPDFSHYRLYRLRRMDDPIDESTRIATLLDTGYVDTPGFPCFYAINSVDVHGNSSPNALIVPFGVTGIDERALPRSVALAPPLPNPSRGVVTLRFALPRECTAILAIYDLAGRRVREALHESRPAGWHTESWDGRDALGRAVAPGLYMARLAAGGVVISQRIFRLE